ALNTLRRYAALVGLDGDALALRMIDAWSNGSAASIPSVPGETGVPVTNVVAAVTTGPDHLRAFTQTGQVPRVGAGSTAAVGGYGYDVATGPPTGTFPVVPRQELRQSKRTVAKARRRLRAPRPLKVVTWVTAGLLVVVLVGIGILQQRPQWLVSAHILRIVEPAGSQGGGGPAAKAPAQTSPVVQTSSGSQTAAYTVSTSDFVVEITTTGKCWVQIISSASPKPLVEGIQNAGMRLGYPATGTMTVEVGSSAVVVGIAVKGKVVFYNAPHTTPFTYTFAPLGHTAG
ncbi:MAG TPA: RodZ domain-containing protein, partial [Acidimicrobiales bacterium]|nr:RodZ domain-containing protein [Acidimicrobiales bacterium]